ncbi:MAG: recombinase family protein [Deltaproteobacteria bacterium]|nr:recombinase family protein [Deltaproteobacteria bacterium]MBI3390309.1 recombinase family protein [Deltaproteobacteria bacterium]
MPSKKAVAAIVSEAQPKSVGIWIRVSTEDQAHGESPEHHEKRARYYAESKGWEVAELYNLAGVSGKAVLEHPEAKRMLADLRRGHITGLIFSKLARLARNTRELLDIADIFRDHEADLVSLGEAIDTSSPAGRLFFTMVAATAQFEREEIASRVAASVPIRARLGKSLGGAAPFGYLWKDRKLVPDPEQVPVVKLIFNLFCEHRRKKTVARLLNDAGHRTRNGSKFSDTTVDRILRDPVAKGTRRANYSKSTGDKKHWVMKPENEWVLSEVEPIVSEEIWNQAKATLDGHRNGRKPAKKVVHLFAGVTFCGCGNKMYVPSNTPKYVCSKCRNKIPVPDLEAVFAEQLKEFVFSPTEVANYLASADQSIKEKEELLRLLENEQQKLQRKMDAIMGLYLDDQLSKEGFGRKNKPLEERFKQIEGQIPELQGELDFLKIQHLSRDEILTEARDLYGRWSDLPSEDKRRIVEAIVDKIMVHKDEVEIDLCYLASVTPREGASELRSRGPSQDMAKWQHLRTDS